MIIIWGISVKKEPLDNLKKKISRQEVPLGFVHLTRSYRSPEISFHFILNGIYGGISSSMLFNSTLHKFEWALPREPEISEKRGDDGQQSLPEIFVFPPLEAKSRMLLLLFLLYISFLYFFVLKILSGLVLCVWSREIIPLSNISKFLLTAMMSC